MPDDETPEQPDLLAILDAFEPMRETLRGIVAAFVTDGFSDEQARVLAVHILTNGGQQ
jgi:hypothetical protein